MKLESVLRSEITKIDCNIIEFLRAIHKRFDEKFQEKEKKYSGYVNIDEYKDYLYSIKGINEILEKVYLNNKYDNVSLELYVSKDPIEQYFGSYFRYYIIAPNGLIISYFDYLSKDSNIIKLRSYLIPGENSDCIVDSHNEVMSLSEVREKWLPIRTGMNKYYNGYDIASYKITYNNKSIFYYDHDSSDHIYQSSNLIYSTPEKAFYLPIAELFFEALNSKHGLNINTFNGLTTIYRDKHNFLEVFFVTKEYSGDYINYTRWRAEIPWDTFKIDIIQPILHDNVRMD